MVHVISHGTVGLLEDLSCKLADLIHIDQTYYPADDHDTYVHNIPLWGNVTCT